MWRRRVRLGLLHSFRLSLSDANEKNRNAMMPPPVAPPGTTRSIGFDPDEVILEKLRQRLRSMTDEELIKFGKEVRRLAENPFQRQLDEARAEFKRRNQLRDAKNG